MRVMSITQPGESDESGARGGKVSHGSAVTHAHQWGKLCMAISTTERGREKSGVEKGLLIASVWIDMHSWVLFR